tara:strand:- start:2220 stop:2570 length:351 start_codon:yes stop_codon:yes gene_type:complete
LLETKISIIFVPSFNGNFATVLKTKTMKTNNENATRRKLIVLSQWLKEYDETCYDSNEGVVESQVRVGVNTALNKIGDYLDEIMFMGNEQIDEELPNNTQLDRDVQQMIDEKLSNK